MRISGYVLELADGSQIPVAYSPYTNAPIVMRSDVPEGQLPAFTASNPPKGVREDWRPSAKVATNACE
jgi:hypothetical protein